jgi:hypothetical protein
VIVTIFEQKSLNLVTIFLILVLLIELFICFLHLFTKNRRKELNVIVAYILFTILNVTILGSLVVKLTGKEFIGLRLFTIVEGLLLILYLHIVIKSSLAKNLIKASLFVFIGFAIFDLFSNKDLDTFDSIPTAVECIIILGFSMFYFYEQLKNPQSLFLYSTPNFWIVVGFIIFFAGNFFLFIYAQSNSNSKEFDDMFGVINVILAFIENILFLIAFIIARKESKSIKSNIVAKTT